MKKIQCLWKCLEKIIFIFCTSICRLLKREMSDEMFNLIMQFVKFAVVGLSNTLISYLIYAISLFLFNSFNVLNNIDYMVAWVLQFFLSVLWSFYWNNKMVFTKANKGHGSIWRSLFRTYISYSFTGLFLSSVLLVFWIKQIGISEYIAPILNLFITMPINFIINKYWAFR